jgi:hypothetical protein
MPACDEVRHTQRTLAALDAAHPRATARLDQARAWRLEVLAEADVAVAASRDVVEAAVVDMAGGTGVEAAAVCTIGKVTRGSPRRADRRGLEGGQAVDGGAHVYHDDAGHAGRPADVDKPGAGDGNQRWSSGLVGSTHRPAHRCRAGVPNVPRPGWGADQ